MQLGGGSGEWRPRGVGAHLRGAFGGRREDVDVEEEQLGLSQPVGVCACKEESAGAPAAPVAPAADSWLQGGGRAQTLRGRGGPGRNMLAHLLSVLGVWSEAAV